MMNEQTSAVERAMPKRTVLAAAAAPVSREDEGTPALNLHIMRNLRLYRVPAAIAGAVAAVALAGLGLSMPRTYSATTSLYVEPVKPSVTQVEAVGMVDPAKYLALIEQLTQTVKRPDVVLRAVHTMPEEVWSTFGKTPEAAAAAIVSGLKVSRQTTSFQVDISLSGKDADAPPQALTNVLNSFLSEEHRIEASDWDTRIDLLSKEYDRSSSDLQDAQARLANITAKLGAAGFTMTPGKTLESGEMEELRTQLGEVDKTRNETLSEMASGGMLKTQDGVNNANSLIAQRQATLRQQMVGMTPANPMYKRDADELASLAKQQNDADAAARKLRTDALQAQIRQSDALSNALRRQMNGQRARVAAAAPMLQQMADLETRVETLTAATRQMELGLRVAKLERDSPSAIKVMALPLDHAAPEKSARSLFLMLAVPVGIFAALVTAVLLSLTRSRIFSSSDVLNASGIPPLAVIPAASDVAEAVREDSYVRIASSIESAFCKNNAQAFVFAPVGSGHSALSTMQAVRTQLMELGYNPLIMRAENLLEGRARVHALDRSAQVDGVRCNETISGAQLRWMRSKHDMVFIESQPLRMSAAGEFAVRAADAVLLVCESRSTMKDELVDTVNFLERLEVPSVGIVLDNLALANADAVERRFLKAAHKTVATSEIRYGKSSEFNLIPSRTRA